MGPAAAPPPLGAEVTVHVALGANLGDRAASLERAVAGLDALPATRVDGVSSWHETAPVGGPAGQPRFLNGVVRLRTRLLPGALLARLQALEAAAGRDRGREVRHGPRTLDLDLLLYGDQRVDLPGLTVPHPGLEERAFVLAPLAELSPELVLPCSGRSVRDRWAELCG